MKINMLSSRILRGSVFVSGALASVVAVNGQLAHQWLFEEPDSTVLSAAVDSVGGSSWSANLGASSIQGGALSLGGTNFGSGGQISRAPLSPSVSDWAAAGNIVTLQVDFRSWTASANRPQYEISLVNASNQLIAGVLFDVGNSAVFLGGISDTGTSLPSSSDISTPRTNTTPHLMNLDLDYTTATYTLSYSTNGGVTFTTIGSDTFGNASQLPVAVQIEAIFTATDTSVLVDSITVIPEPSTYAAIFGLLALGFLVWRRRAQRA